jgi:hypothetical protein
MLDEEGALCCVFPDVVLAPDWLLGVCSSDSQYFSLCVSVCVFLLGIMYHYTTLLNLYELERHQMCDSNCHWNNFCPNSLNNRLIYKMIIVQI